MANVHQAAMVSKVVEVTLRCSNKVPFSCISQSKPSSPTHCIGRMIMTMCVHTRWLRVLPPWLAHKWPSMRSTGVSLRIKDN